MVEAAASTWGAGCWCRGKADVQSTEDTSEGSGPGKDLLLLLLFFYFVLVRFDFLRRGFSVTLAVLELILQTFLP